MILPARRKNLPSVCGLILPMRKALSFASTALDAAQPQGLPAAYVARLFDDYAPRFNAHLVRELSYRGPELIADALDAVAPERKFRRGLDVGCGSGLAGAALRARSEVLIGVDISSKMILEAERTKLYDELAVGDFSAFLAEQPEGEADLVVAADVFAYVGDLAPAFTAIARALSATAFWRSRSKPNPARLSDSARRCAFAIPAPTSSARSPRRGWTPSCCRTLGREKKPARPPPASLRSLRPQDRRVELAAEHEDRGDEIEKHQRDHNISEPGIGVDVISRVFA